MVTQGNYGTKVMRFNEAKQFMRRAVARGRNRCGKMSNVMAEISPKLKEESVKMSW